MGKSFSIMCGNLISKMNEKINSKYLQLWLLLPGSGSGAVLEGHPWPLKSHLPRICVTNKPESQSGYLHGRCSQNTWFQALPDTAV